MRLREDFIFQELDGDTFLVPLGHDTFKGMVRCNKTARTVLELLQEETTEAELTERYAKLYGLSAEAAEEDVRFVLGKFRSVGALEE